MRGIENAVRGEGVGERLKREMKMGIKVQPLRSSGLSAVRHHGVCPGVSEWGFHLTWNPEVMHMSLPHTAGKG